MATRAALKNRIAAVIFDCDGVIFESREANVAYHNAILKKLGQPPLSERERELSYVLSTRELYAQRFPNDTAAVEAAVLAARSTDYSQFYPLMKPVAGLEEALRKLKGTYKLGVASNRGRSLYGVLDHFGLSRYFDVAAGTGDVERPKPHPDLILHCLEKLRVEPARAIYVGDTATDRLAAEAAGVGFIGAAGGTGAELAVDRIEQLPVLLGTLA